MKFREWNKYIEWKHRLCDGVYFIDFVYDGYDTIDADGDGLFWFDKEEKSKETINNTVKDALAYFNANKNTLIKKKGFKIEIHNIFKPYFKV